MSKTPVPHAMAVVLTVAVLSLTLMAASIAAATSVFTPAGTKVGLTFLDPVDTAKAASGNKVHFKVAEDVIVNRQIVIKKGTTLVGTINEVGHPFPQNAGFANISFLTVTAVDKKTVDLTDVRVSAPLFGGNIQVRVGTFVTTSTKTDVTINVP